MRLRNALLIGVLAPVMYLMVLGLGLIVSAHSAGFRRTCFPANRWGPAPQQYRPCVQISRLYEDGSFKYRVSDFNGTVRYSGGVGAEDR
jgi:hypothetical protein